jgi:hypothetical protein
MCNEINLKKEIDEHCFVILHFVFIKYCIKEIN